MMSHQQVSRPRVLVIAGSDPGGQAGLLRDVQTLRDFETEPVCALTAVTAQTDAEVLNVQWVSGGLLRQQVQAALSGGPVAAVKIGMVGSAENVQLLAQLLGSADWPAVVLDPVLAASSGGELLAPTARADLRTRLLPLITVLTPNVAEAAWLLNEQPADDEGGRLAQGQRLQALGVSSVLLKGGHAGGDVARDILLMPGGEVFFLDAPRQNAQMRGTGCALSSAIAASLAHGLPMQEACRQAKQYVHQRLSAIATRAHQ